MSIGEARAGTPAPRRFRVRGGGSVSSEAELSRRVREIGGYGGVLMLGDFNHQAAVLSVQADLPAEVDKGRRVAKAVGIASSTVLRVCN